MGPVIRRAPTLLLTCLAWGCGDRTPAFTEVDILRDTGDPAGPFAVVALVRPGDGETTVRLRLSDQGADGLLGDCSAGVERGPWRNVDDVSDAAPAPLDTSVDASPTDGGATDSGTDGDVADGGRPNPQPDPERAPCALVPLSESGGLWRARFGGPPYALGTRLFFVIEARDEDGDTALWPASGVSWVDIGPPGHAPEVSGVAPTSGPAAGGTEVLLRGDGFARDTEVRFGAEAAAAVDVVSNHLLAVRTPPGTPGPVDIVVSRAGLETRLPGAFTYLPPPEVHAVAPGEGPATDETLVVVDGAWFQDGAVVSFDNRALDTRWLSADRVTAVAPPHPPGAVDVRVTNPDAQRGTLERGFRYRAAPVLTALTPAVGPDTGDTLVRVEGEDLRAPGAVYLGERPASDVRLEPGGVAATFLTPLQPEGVVDVTWFNPDGQWSTLPMAFRYLGPPAIERAEPAIASRCGGSVATIIGRNFVEDSRVFVGGVEVEVRSIDADGTRIEIVLPAGDPGGVRVEVVNPDGRQAAVDDLIEFGVRPVVRSIDVREHPVWGGTAVTIDGGDFELGAVASFGGTRAEQTNVRREGCDAVIDAIVPAHAPNPVPQRLAAVVELTVTNIDGSAGTLADAVAYIQPTLTQQVGLTPGYTNGALRGLDLRQGLTIRIGDRRVRASDRVSDTEWRIVTAAGEQGPAELEVRNRDGRGVVLPDRFSYRRWRDETNGRFEPGFDCNDVSVGDLDGDGDPDLVAAHGAVGQIGTLEQRPRVHLNDGRARFAARELDPAGNGMNARLGDFDDDGDLDLLVANLASSRDHLFTNDGRGSFREVRNLANPGPSYDGDFLDHDGDGDLDVFLLANGSPGNNAVDGPEQLYINQGGGRFVEQSDLVDFDIRDVHDHDFAHGDLNGDGLPDVVIVVDNLSDSFQSSRNRLLINRGGRYEFAPSPFNDAPGDWLHVELADIDGDGDLDVLLPQDYVEGFSRPGTPAIGVYLNDGDANFEPAHHYIHDFPRLPAFEAVAADVDLDGDQDLLVAIYGALYQDGTIDAFASTVLLNDGTGHLWESASAFESRLDIATADFGPADFDGDGDVDLVECAARGESRLWMQVE